MLKRLGVLGCALVAMSCIWATGASAATTIGSPCTGNNQEGPKLLTQLALASGSPLAAPEAGVVTKWGVNVIPYPGGISEKLKVLRPAPASNSFTVVGESTVQPIVGGTNTFDTRIPIQAGDHVGVISIGGEGTGTILCLEEGGDAGNVMGIAPTEVALNSIATFVETPKMQAAVTATIEKDADNDGYGDETQDKCPESAASHDPCPVLILDAVSQPPGRSAVRILVASSSDSAIVVSASAKLPGNSTKKARVSAQAKLAPINQLVTPGKIATYTMNFTKSLKDALKALPKKKSLKLSVVASGKGLDGSSSSDKLTVKLRGQAK